MSTGLATIGNVTGNRTLVFQAQVFAGLDLALNNPISQPCWRGEVGPIAMYQNIASQLAGVPGMMGKVIPNTAIFPFSAPTAAMELLLGGSSGRTLQPLVRESLTVTIDKYGCGYFVDRQTFFGDVYGIIRRWIEKLSRPSTKLGDVLLARVLRNGKSTLDWTQTNFFSTSKPQAPSGSLAPGVVYSNLYTGCGLTPANALRVWDGMRSIKGEDGYSLNIKPDTAIIPSELDSKAHQAFTIEYPVYSQTANAWNATQATGTAAMGQNLMAVAKRIKQIVVLPELTQGGASIDTTSWYMAECLNPEHGGAPGLVLADDPAVDLFLQLDTTSTEVYNNDRFAAAIQKFAGAGPGLGQWVSRADA